MTQSLAAQFNVDPVTGYLPARDPLRALPPRYAAWDRIGEQLPKLLVSFRVREAVQALPELDASGLASDLEVQRAMMVLSFVGHAYVWGLGTEQPLPTIPRTLAVPWHALAQRLGRPPVLSYDSYAMHNWQRIDPAGPIQIGNIALLQNFLAGVDEEWFILIHVDIEAKAARLLASLVKLKSLAAAADSVGLAKELAVSSSVLSEMYDVLCRMPEHCDPYIYYNRVRPYIHGWKNSPGLPSGLIYEGVDAYAGAPQQFRGETGSQSSIVPAIDAALGIEHGNDRLKAYLEEMKEYMPPKHRAFIDHLGAGPSVREFVLREMGAHPDLRERYNDCVRWLAKFRSKHLEYAVSYIEKQQQTSASNPTAVGTGGTPFVPYLSKHRDETAHHLL